jgi:hypothetical protein
MKNEKGEKRAKVMAAVGLNALMGALVGYGLKKGASELGQLLGGDEDEEAEQKMREYAVWDTVSNLAGTVYFGDWAIDIARKIATGHKSPLFMSAPHEAMEDIVSGFTSMAQAVNKWAATEGDDAEKASGQMLKSLEKLIVASGTAGGVPLVPLYKLGKRVYESATNKAEDPRRVEKRATLKDRLERNKEIRNSIPGLDRLLTEYAQLQDVKRTPEEQDRYMKLKFVRNAYDDLLTNDRKGMTDLAKQNRETLTKAVKERQ